MGSNDGVMSLFGAKPQDPEVPNIQTDSISSLAFSPTADFLAVGSWSNEVRVFQVAQNGSSEGKAAFSHDAPILDVCWSNDGSKILSGSADKTAKLFDVTTGQANQVAAHDGPIKNVGWVNMNNGILATSSWDKTLRYWDLRTPNAIGSVQLPERAYAMSIMGSLLVVATAERKVVVVNLADPTKIYMEKNTSPLKLQTRAIAAWPDQQGYAVSSVEGRVAIQWIQEDKTSDKDNFSFKCHRSPPDPRNQNKVKVYPVNVLEFNSLGTFATAGGDGVVSFWDKDSKTRTKVFEPAGGPITAASFSSSSQLFAYSVSYDWSQGYAGNRPGQTNKVCIHICKEDEVKKRVKK